VYSQLAVRSTPASMAGPIAVRSTQFGGGLSRILCVLRRKKWVEDCRYVALGQKWDIFALFQYTY